MNPEPNAVLIIGSTSSVGQSLAAEYGRRGWRLILASRDRDFQAEEAADLRIRYVVEVEEYSYNAEDPFSAKSLANALRTRMFPKKVFILIGDPGNPEQDLNDAIAAIRVTQVNYVGATALVAEMLVQIEEHRGTQIILIGSIAGIRGRASNPLYCAAKAALEVFAQGLRQRLYRRGVGVLLVRLGYVDSRMSYGLTAPFLTLSPGKAARQIIHAAEAGRDVVFIPNWWLPAMLTLRLIPEWLWKRLPPF